MKRWEKTGLLSLDDKNGDERIQFYNDKTTDATVIAHVEKAGWKRNELDVNADIIVLANPEIALLPNWVIALIAAGTVALAFGIAASSLFPAIMLGIFAKSINKQGAIAGMLAGLTVTLFYVFAHKGILFIKGTEYLSLVGGKNGWFGLAPEAIGTLGAIVNFIVAYFVSKSTKPTPVEIQELVESIRIPKRA